MNTLTIAVCRDGIRDEIHVFESTQTIVVGKDPTCVDLVLNDRGVSRQHCKFAFLNGTWTICDLGSTNGLTINGKSMAGRQLASHSLPIALGNGDAIGIGVVILKICIQPPSMDTTEVLTPTVVAELLKSVTEAFEPRDASVVSNPMNHVHTMLVAPLMPPIQPRQEKQETKPVVKRQPSDSKPQPIVSKGNTGTIASPTPMARKLPCDFRNYSLRERIGIGGMGEVILAVDKRTPQTTCAIKFLKTHAAQSSSERLRFIREMEIAFKLKHTFLVECFECGEDESQLFIAMAYCNGGNLHEFLSRTGKLSVRRAIRLMYRILAGVDEAHRQGIVHRDLKPSNILLHREADGLYFPKISDFGLAKSFLDAGESGMTLNGTVGGSWAYMPKEQVLNFRYLLPQSDVWSLGAILYECITNRLPRKIERGKDPIRSILESQSIPIDQVEKDLPPAFVKFIATALETDANKRFSNAGEMRSALQEVALEIGVEL